MLGMNTSVKTKLCFLYKTGSSFCVLEHDFPVMAQMITTHLLLHEPDARERLGPVHSRWMYPFERLNSYISRRIQNRRFPEACAIITIQIADFVYDALLGQRIKRAREKPKKNIERIILESIGVPFHVQRKRKKTSSLSADEVTKINDELSLLIEKEVTIMNKYVAKNVGDMGSVIYESGETTNKKSSRFVFVKKEDKYGEILAILNCDGNIIFKLSMFLDIKTDYETNLPYVDMSECRRDVKFNVLQDLSRPLIVGRTNRCLYFISVDHSSHFEWLTGHI